MGAAVLNSDEGTHGHNHIVFAVTTATIALATLFVGARLVCQYFIVRNVTWDDRVILIAWLLAFSLSFLLDYGTWNGLGVHEVEIKYSRRILRHCEYAFSVLYNPALMATKTSILILYIRIARNTQLLLRYASWFTLIIVNLVGFVLTFINIFQCRPISAAWRLDPSGFILTFINIFQCRPISAAWRLDDGTANAVCIPLLVEFISASPVNIITDLAILILPIPTLTSMRLPLRQKVVMIFAFALGAFITIIGVVRIYYLQHVVSERSGQTWTGFVILSDGKVVIPRDASFSLMWSVVEVNVGITCACVPTIKPLIRKFSPNLLKDSNSNTTKSLGRAESQTPLFQNSTSEPESTEPAHVSAETIMAVSDGADCGFRYGSEHSTVVSPASTTATGKSGTSFAFVNTSGPICILKVSMAESAKYCAIVSVLFFLSGMSYGLLDSVNGAVTTVGHFSTAQSIGLSAVYSGLGYIFGPLLVSELLLHQDRWLLLSKRLAFDVDCVSGYKATVIVGLCAYGIGTISFWPSAVTSSYPGFLLSNFLIGFGLAVIEVGANSFVILCGPPNYSEARILIAQAIQGCGSVTNSLLAQRVFLKDINTSGIVTIVSVQWVYLGVTLLCAILGLFFFYVPLPDVSDDDIDDLSNRLQIDPKKEMPGGLQLRTVSLILAVFAQYMFYAAMGSNFTFFENLINAVVPREASTGEGEAADPDRPPGLTLSISDTILVGRAAQTVVNVVLGYLTYLSVSIRWLPRASSYLTFGIIMCLAFSIVRVVYKPSDPNKFAIIMVVSFIAETPLWPLYIAFGLRGQGRRTKQAAAFITMAESGPAIIPFIMYGIVNAGGTVQISYIVPTVVLFMSAMYPAFLELSRSGRQLLKPYTNEQEALNRSQENPISPPSTRQDETV
ncbi:hypothetical protein HIM_11067 [Hirsutella minnesotensis 3608]|uniref:Rhodopsin domain-containing protein n=1 Tax=Hirsutella minnesotensis 3608 TaxID=1043627 RepID=A0A0F7ZWT7_9HYPO|nr:hypothetical protein HIM_11067 [Hirsutella minnesotensis 3608]